MKIKEIKRKISNKSITGFTKDYQRGYIAMRDFALSLLNQLDEEKEKEIPVVPQYVADWFEKNKDNLEHRIWKYHNDWRDHDPSDEFYLWMDHYVGHPIETLVKMKNGYKIEKPMWAIKNECGNYLTKFSLWGTDGINYSFEFNPDRKLLFTNEEAAQSISLLVNGETVFLGNKVEIHG